MSWADYHRRDAVLRSVIAYVDQHIDGRLPWSEVDGVADAFDSPDALLSALQMRWYTRLVGAIETELSDQPDELEDAVVAAWRRAADEHPGIRLVLDANARHPMLERAYRKEWAMLAVESGKAGLADAGLTDARAVPVGRRIAARAAEGWTAPEPVEKSRHTWRDLFHLHA